jgi:hypothetical protein
MNPADLLDDVQAFLGRFTAMPHEHALPAITLWVAHTHVIGHLYSTPRLAMLSPEPGSGKTRVLEVVNTLSADAILAFSATPAAIFRLLARGPVTLLMDETDAIFSSNGKDDPNADLRALLNAGYKKSNVVLRVVGPKHEVHEFPAFAAVALAGLGDLPATVMDRSIVIRMRKRAPTERVEPWNMRRNEPQGYALRDRLNAWCSPIGEQIGDAEPDLPDGVVDRAAELWQPLVALADAAGGHWPETARAACRHFVLVESDRPASLGVLLLQDIRAVFDDADVTGMSTVALLDRLTRLEMSPWGDIRGKPLTARGLAKRLRLYQLAPRKVRTPLDANPVQGYLREDFHDAWQRYLQDTPVTTDAPAEQVSDAAA